ncbi:hypothetical protein QTP86_002487 [Hemibagrus guttatus]|nr:hypothetical protein QTP86_002487 [Hemibagrus guttatus]
MPYGVTNAPAVFQSLVNELFRDILNQFVIAYIVDILIYSATLEDHVRHVRIVLTCLLQNNLYVKLEKCEFHRTTLTFLGYVLFPAGVEMDQSKVWAVTNWPVPTTVKELQRFLAFANFYRRFIWDYSTIAGHLISLLNGKPKRLHWSEPAQKAFSKLKNSFTTMPILRQPDPEAPFIVEVDASGCGIGAVLSQRQPDSGKVHPCAYFSRKLTTAENNYDVGNEELLSIKAALEEWHH